MRLLVTAIVFVIFNLSGLAYGQEQNSTSFDRTKWRELTKGIDYSAEEAKEKQPEEKDQESGDKKGTNPSGGGSIFPVGGQVFQIIMIAAFIILLIFIISKLVGNNLRLNRRNSGENAEQVLENIEENLLESDLMRWLNKAVDDKNYRLALRIYYLMIIKELATKKLINWRKEKTNLEYLYEMRDHESYDQFEEVTGVYQVVWYGEKDLGDNYLLEVSHKFKSYFQSINALNDG